MMKRNGLFLLFATLSCSGVIDPGPADDFSIVKYNNPDAVVDLGVGLWAWPVPLDYDNDGDMDLLVSSQGKPFNGLYLFENKSGGSNPVFEKPVRLTSSIKDIQVSYLNGVPRVLVPGSELMDFNRTFDKNKRKLFPVDSIIKDFTKKPRFNQWKMVDYDNDGDEDIVVGVDDWNEYGMDNGFDQSGKWVKGPLHGYVYLVENNKGQYHNKGRIQVEGKDLDVYGMPSPNFADFDHDGDLDLICGEFLDKLNWFENTGTREKPVYARPRFLENEGGTIQMDLEMIVPVAVDWNKDGFIDLIIGDEDGRVAFAENTGRIKDRMPVFKSPVYFRQKADNLKFGALATPYSVDWDNDGREDIICGNSAGYIAFIKNLGGEDETPRWAPPELLKSNDTIIRIQAGYNGSIQGPAEAKWGYTTLSVADWDSDGLKDILVNSIWGKVIWYRNIGTATTPKLAAAADVKVDWGKEASPKPVWNWWDPEHAQSLVTQWRTVPYAIDWNKDGLMDLIMLDQEGYLCYFERFSKDRTLLLKPGKRIFYVTNASGFNHNHVATDSLPGLLQLNTGIAGRSGRRKFCITDWDGDGLLDILVNSKNISLLKNTGTKDGLVQLVNAGMFSDMLLAGHVTSPTVVDWNKDSVPDLLVGAEDGHFYYYRNNSRSSQSQEKDPPGIAIVKSTDPQNLYVASPSLVILPDSSYLVSHDWSGPATKGITRTSVYHSTDKGQHWQRIADIDGLRWATLFLHRGAVYLLGVNRSYGDIHIFRSTDGGHNWTKPAATSGILFKGRHFHTGPVPVVVHNGRIWRAFEERPDPKHKGPIGVFVISAPENSDLLLPSNWTRTNSIVFNKQWINSNNPITIEGNVVVTPEGKVADLLRLETHPGKNDAFELEGYAKGIPRFEVAPLMEVSADGKKMTFTPQTGFLHFPGAESKFTIRYDSVTRRYWTIANKITKMHPDTDFNISPHRQRNVMSLFSSADLKEWTEHTRILRWKEGTIMNKMSPVGFQYVDWQFEGKDIVFVCRTGWFGKRSHDANYITFHRLTNFRSLTMADSGADLGK